MKLPQFIQQVAERAIEDALHPKGMHTNGKCMVAMEVSQFQRLLMVATLNSDGYKVGYDDGWEACQATYDGV